MQHGGTEPSTLQTGYPTTQRRETFREKVPLGADRTERRAIMEGLNPKKVFSLLFIAAIAVIFTLQWGPGSTGFGQTGAGPVAGAAAVVNGVEIPLRTFSME